MSFKNNYIGFDNQAPLINYDIKIIYKESIKEYNLLKESIDSIKDYNLNLEKYSKNQFFKNKDLIHSKLFSLKNQFTSLMQKFNFLIENLENLKDKSLITSNKEKVEKFISEIPNIIEFIFEKEKNLSLKFMNISITETDLNESLQYLNVSAYDKLNDSKIISAEIIANKEYLEKRQQELEDIKKVTNQIKEISNIMGIKLKEQAMLVDDLETNIDHARTNINRAEREISQISNKEKKMRLFDKKSLYLISLIILVVIVIILFLIFFIKRT